MHRILMCLSTMCDTVMTVNISNGRFLSITAEYMVSCLGHGASKLFSRVDRTISKKYVLAAQIFIDSSLEV